MLQNRRTRPGKKPIRLLVEEGVAGEEEEVCGVGVAGGGVCGVEEVEVEAGVVGGDSRPFRNILRKT